VTEQPGLDFIYSLQRFGIKLGLDKMRTLLARGGNPQRGLQIVHIAGTNGKGSTARALAGLLQAGGAKVGLFTSPHLHRFNERIQVDGEPISDTALERLTGEIEADCRELSATFFEACSLLAMLYFAEQQVDWAVLETGLGGRLDATNAVVPRLCLLSSIAVDHSAYLGDTLTDIATEKAGIIKPGIPVISVAQATEVVKVLQYHCLEKGADLYLEGEHWSSDRRGEGLRFSGFGRRHQQTVLGLRGRHQVENVGLALAAQAWLTLQGVVGWPERCAESLTQLSWPGRLEWWQGGDEILLDGAHNPAGCHALADYLQESGVGPVVLLLGVKQDKAWQAMLEPLRPLVSHLHLVPLPVEENQASRSLCDWAEKVSLPCSLHGDRESGLKAARRMAGRNQAVVVTGSLYLVAAIRQLLTQGGRHETALQRAL